MDLFAIITDRKGVKEGRGKGKEEDRRWMCQRYLLFPFTTGSVNAAIQGASNGKKCCSRKETAKSRDYFICADIAALNLGVVKCKYFSF